MVASRSNDDTLSVVFFKGGHSDRRCQGCEYLVRLLAVLVNIIIPTDVENKPSLSNEGGIKN